MRTFYIPEKYWKAFLLVCLVFAMWGLVWLAEYYAAAPTVSSDPYYSGSESGGMACFAVNVDWGEEYIPAMLDLFDEKGVQCTFFLTGRWAENHPDLAREMVRRGHELGNHAYSHKSPNGMTQAENQQEIQRTQQAIKAATGVETTLYAPPSGEREDQVLAAAVAESHHIILWSVDTIDWQKPTPEVMAERVLTKATQGSIILMHPTENTVKALPTIIDTLQSRGLTLGTVSAVCRLYEQPEPEPEPAAEKKTVDTGVSLGEPLPIHERAAAAYENSLGNAGIARTEGAA